jgi:membrane associated rhomboid family serine protease/Zn-finger nucleic acid-binding protein
MKCPRCDLSLKIRKVLGGKLSFCSNCGGFATTLSFAKKLLKHLTDKVFWDSSKRTEQDQTCCPSCTMLCKETAINLNPNIKLMYYSQDSHTVFIDVCPNCHTVWFDPLELEQLGYSLENPDSEFSYKNPSLAKDIRQELALIELHTQKLDSETSLGLKGPDTALEQLLQYLGISTSLNGKFSHSEPTVITPILVIVINFYFWLECLKNFKLKLYLSLVPTIFANSNTVKPKIFVSDNLIPLLICSYIFYNFGRDLEVFLKRNHFLLLIAISIICSLLLTYFSSITLDKVGFYGLNGLVSGVLVAYTVIFPKARLASYGFRSKFSGVYSPPEPFIISVRFLVLLWLSFLPFMIYIDRAIIPHIGGILGSIVFLFYFNTVKAK